jgi:hypothetical protein
VVNTRDESGAVRGGVGAFVVVNVDGWAFTAAHVFDASKKYEADAQARADRAKRVAAIQSNVKFSPQRKKHEIQSVPLNPEWLTNVSNWWAYNGVVASVGYVNEAADLALVKLDNLPGGSVTGYPVFGNVANRIAPGDYVCKVGFPFNDVAVTWDAPTGMFNMANASWPAFPLEGMITREIFHADQAGNVVARGLETSTPGLRGQSGGPWLDSDSRVWAIQTKTFHYNLGFPQTIKDGARTVTQHQFLNTGWGADVEEIIKLAGANGVHIDIAQ